MGRREESGVWKVDRLDGSPREVGQMVAATFAWLGAWAEDAMGRVLSGRAPRRLEPARDAFAQGQQ